MAGMTKQELIARLHEQASLSSSGRVTSISGLACNIQKDGLAAEEEAKKLRAMAFELVKQRDEARKEVEQLQGQLANCAVAARGYAWGINDCEKGAYGWSASFEDVKELYAEKERLREKLNEESPPWAAVTVAAQTREIDRLKAELEIAAKENGRLRRDNASDIEWSVKARDSFCRVEDAAGVIPVAGDTWISRADRIIEAIEKLKEKWEAFDRIMVQSDKGITHTFTKEAVEEVLKKLVEQRRPGSEHAFDVIDRLIAQAKRADMAQAQAEHWAEKAGRFARNILDAKTVLDRQSAQPGVANS